MSIPAHRLRKELRILAVPWVVAMLAVVYLTLAALQQEEGPLRDTGFLALMLQFTAVFLMAALSFGSEFGHGTMERLLAQPVARSVIWREKMQVLASLVGLLIVGNVICTACVVSRQYSDNHAGSLLLYLGRSIVQPGFLIAFSGLAVALCTGPLMSLLLKQTHTAFWAAMVSPVLCLLVLGAIDSIIVRLITGVSLIAKLTDSIRPFPGVLGVILLFTIPWCIFTYYYGRAVFLRLEV